MLLSGAQNQNDPNFFPNKARQNKAKETKTWRRKTTAEQKI
jgi:hypothetical protein